MCCSGHGPKLRPPSLRATGLLQSLQRSKTRIIVGEVVMPRRSLVMGIGFLGFLAWLAGTGKLPGEVAAQALGGKVTAQQRALESGLGRPQRTGSAGSRPGLAADKRPLRFSACR